MIPPLSKRLVLSCRGALRLDIEPLWIGLEKFVLQVDPDLLVQDKAEKQGAPVLGPIRHLFSKKVKGERGLGAVGGNQGQIRGIAGLVKVTPNHLILGQVLGGLFFHVRQGEEPRVRLQVHLVHGNHKIVVGYAVGGETPGGGMSHDEGSTLQSGFYRRAQARIFAVGLELFHEQHGRGGVDYLTGSAVNVKHKKGGLARERDMHGRQGLSHVRNGQVGEGMNSLLFEEEGPVQEMSRAVETALEPIAKAGPRVTFQHPL